MPTLQRDRGAVIGSLPTWSTPYESLAQWLKILTQSGCLERRLKGLETENAGLRRAAADLTLDKLILAEAAKGNV